MHVAAILATAILGAGATASTVHPVVGPVAVWAGSENSHCPGPYLNQSVRLSGGCYSLNTTEIESLRLFYVKPRCTCEIYNNSCATDI